MPLNFDFVTKLPVTPDAKTVGQAQEGWGAYKEKKILETQRTQKLDTKSAIDALPNSEKLTAGERWLTGALPGFAQSTIGEAMQWFGQGIQGEAMKAFDFLAVPFERAIGLAWQAGQAVDEGTWGEFMKEIDTAWFAGSLAYDVTNAPSIGQFEDGKWGIHIPMDLPGLDYMYTLRDRIGALVDSGATYNEALTTVTNNYYVDQGALAIRAQMQDTLGHIFLDPANYILPMLAPIKTAQFARKLINAFGVCDDFVDSSKALIKIAEEAGDLAEVERLNSLLNTLDKVSNKPLLKLFTKYDKFTIALTGGDILETGKTAHWYNPLTYFYLTPAARAWEVMTVGSDNIGTYVLGHFGPDEATEILEKVAAGSVTDPRIAHAFITPEGRAAQSLLSTAGIRARALLNVKMAAAGDITNLNDYAKLLETSPERLMMLLTEHADEVPALVGRLTEKGLAINADSLLMLGKKLKDVPFTDELWKLMTMNKITDDIEQQAIVLFGVKMRGPLQKASSTLKSVETLAFLRANPAYFMKNAVNDEITIVGRGMMGYVSIDDIKILIKEDLGFNPMRFSSGFGAVGEKIGKDIDRPGQLIERVLRGEDIATQGAKKTSNWYRFTDWIGSREFKIGGKRVYPDFGKMSADWEANASARATYMGYSEGNRQLNKIGVGLDNARDVIKKDILEGIETKHPDIVDEIHNTLISARANPEKLGSIIGADNLRINTEAIFKEASKELGYDIQDSLPTEILDKVAAGLPDAMKAKRVPEYIAGIRAGWMDDMSSASSKYVDEIMDYTEIKMAEGPNAYKDIIGNALDEYHESDIFHAMYAERMGNIISGTKGTGLTHKLWNNALEDYDKFYTHINDRLEGTIKGLMKGAKKYDLTVPDEVLGSYKTMRNTNNAFYKLRSKLYEDFFSAIEKGKTPSIEWDAIKKTLNDEYLNLVKTEDTMLGRIDKYLAKMIKDPAQRKVFLDSRKIAADLRLADRMNVVEFRKSIEGLSPDAVNAKYSEWWQARVPRIMEKQANDKTLIAAMTGNPEAINKISQGAAGITEIAPEAGKVAGAVEEAGKVTEEVAGGVDRNFVASMDAIAKPPRPDAIGREQYYQWKGMAALDAIEEGAIRQAAKPALKWDDLTKVEQDALVHYLEIQKGNMADIRYASLRYGEFRRDAALLNYNRRLNFDTYAGTLFPYEFWMTHSMFNWALHSIDNPAMLSSYLRIKNLAFTAGLPDRELPTRLRGHLKMHLPFLPEWMGDLYIDPMKMIFPFDQFTYAFEQMGQRNLSVEGKTERMLQEWLDAGKYNSADIQSALDTQSGEIWEMARSQVLADNEDLKFDPFDFMQLFSAPHAPLTWAGEYLKGTPEDIGPLTPMSRMIKQVTGLFGIDWNNSKLNIEARVREALGLPAFSKFDDYFIDRMLSNMAAMGEITADEARRAMIDRTGDIYQEAVRKSNIEAGAGLITSLLGIPAKFYPEGELRLRSLQDEYNHAWEVYNTTGEYDAVNKFEEEHPEYLARLALFDEPEERLRKFVTDEIWDIYNNLPTLTKKEIRDQLGDEFLTKFIDADTRSYGSITVEQLQVWSILMGGDPPGTLPKVMPASLKLTDPVIAQRAQMFYDTRNMLYGDYYDLQNQYYDLPEGVQRKAFLKRYPRLVDYWDWRRDFLYKNPELAPYLTDSKNLPEYKSAKELAKVTEAQPTFSERDWNIQFGNNLANLLKDYIFYGDSLSDTAMEKLKEIADRLGLTVQEVIEKYQSVLQ